MDIYDGIVHFHKGDSIRFNTYWWDFTNTE